MKLHEWQAKMKDEQNPASAIAVSIWQHRHFDLHGQYDWHGCPRCEAQPSSYAQNPFLKDESGEADP